MNQISAFINEISQSALGPSTENTARKHWPGRGLPPTPDRVGNLISDVQPSRRAENKFLLSTIFPVMIFIIINIKYVKRTKHPACQKCNVSNSYVPVGIRQPNLIGAYFSHNKENPNHSERYLGTFTLMSSVAYTTSMNNI